MKIEPSARLAHFQTGIFAALNELPVETIRELIDVIDKSGIIPR